MEQKENKYHKSKIYTIRSPYTDKFYIGSTTQLLSSRFNKHKTALQCSSKEIIKLGDAYIELLEYFKCDTREELNKKEGEIIRQYKDQCVNKRIEGRTSKEWSQDDYKNNKEKYQIKAKIRYENKKDLIIEQQLNYYNNNKEIILSKQKEYINNNKETIEEKGKEKITCECGAIISKWGLTNHKKTLAHLSIV
jgi:hypothetical protein